MMSPIDTVVTIMLVFILGNITARMDKASAELHKDCDWSLKIYYAALLGACFRMDPDKFQELAKSFIESSEKLLKEDKK